jgi:hypothetical protein
MKKDQADEELAEKIRQMCRLYGRIAKKKQK